MNYLGISGLPEDTRVVVAMSGGVDSSVAAALLAEKGFDVVGVTLQLYDHSGPASKTCCAGQDIRDARRVAEELGIPHYVLNYESRFREDVIDSFVDSYVRGETPVPCVQCNQTVKFRDLLGVARDLGAAALATGHYIRRVDGTGGPELHCAVDRDRDQSYFLFATTREQAEFLRFPVGELTKSEVRRQAERLGLPVAAKPDSQDICFVPDGNYAAVVRRLQPGAIDPGDIVHVDGRILGRHEGIVDFTVGQRRGLGISGQPEPLHVIRIEPAARRVVVGPASALGTQTFGLDGVNWLERPGDSARRLSVKVRSAQAPVPATIFHYPRQDSARVQLDHPARAVAPGQACVFYDGDRLMGGGWISREERRQAG